MTFYFGNSLFFEVCNVHKSFRNQNDDGRIILFCQIHVINITTGKKLTEWLLTSMQTVLDVPLVSQPSIFFYNNSIWFQNNYKYWRLFSQVNYIRCVWLSAEFFQSVFDMFFDSK
jgi:hypothetical protein